jgi:hypothetical protein
LKRIGREQAETDNCPDKEQKQKTDTDNTLEMCTQNNVPDRQITDEVESNQEKSAQESHRKAAIV